MKACNRCEITKSLDEYYPSRNGVKSICKECTHKRHKQYHATHKRKPYTNPNTNTNKLLKDSVKQFYGCLNPACPCVGMLPAHCLDFHHIEDKSFQIGCGGRGVTSLVTEMNKCTILCAVCHRMETWSYLDCSQFRRCCVNCDGKPE